MTFTALLDAHEPPATTVTDALGAAAADAELLPPAAGVELLLLPLLHAASSVIAAALASPATASRLVVIRVIFLSGVLGNIGGLLCWLLVTAVQAGLAAAVLTAGGVSG